MTFREQLILTIVDKAVIGILVAAAAYFFSKALEKFKSTRSLNNEFDKQRIMKIAELWESSYKCEDAVLMQSRYVGKAIASGGAGLDLRLEPYTPELVDLIKTTRELQQTIGYGRFWLGDLLYERFMEYQQLLHGHVGSLLERPVEAKPERQLVEELGRLRQSIWDYCAAQE
jgi:hypothetical protein